jgi:hypothetical protein
MHVTVDPARLSIQEAYDRQLFQPRLQ